MKTPFDFNREYTFPDVAYRVIPFGVSAGGRLWVVTTKPIGGAPRFGNGFFCPVCHRLERKPFECTHKEAA